MLVEGFSFKPVKTSSYPFNYFFFFFSFLFIPLEDTHRISSSSFIYKVLLEKAHGYSLCVVAPQQNCEHCSTDSNTSLFILAISLQEFA